MPERFFLADVVAPTGTVHITGPLAQHLSRSLRLRAGDSIVGVDPSGREHGLRLRSVGTGAVDADVAWSRAATGEPALRITVLQALPRERMEDCIDILVEVGAAAIRPVVTERVVTRADAARLAARAQRWQAVAQEAAQLAGRGTVPPVHPPVALADAIEALDPGTRIIACTFDGHRPLGSLTLDAATPLALCIGPEGGFGERDMQALRHGRAELVHMGARILRTRYAGAVACALLLGAANDLEQPVAAEPEV